MLDPLKGQQLPAIGGFLPMMGAAGDAPFFGGGVGGAASPGPFDLEPVEVEGQDNQYKVVNRYLYFGRMLLTDSNKPSGDDGEETLFTLPPNSLWTLYAVITHTTSGEPELTVEKKTLPPSSSSNDMDKTYIALWYNHSKGSGYEMLDLRRAPVTAAYLPA